MKLPGNLAPLGIISTLQDEIAQERAASLGRVTRAFEEALGALRRHDSENAYVARDDTRERLLDEAGEALWCFVVQREACGLRNTDAVLRELKVPLALRLRMGVRRQPAKTQIG
jgi:hypothetical protein